MRFQYIHSDSSSGNAGRGRGAVTHEGEEKSFQDQRVAQKQGVAGLTGEDSSLVRGALKGMSEKQSRKSEGSEKRVLSPDLEGVQKASSTDESKNVKKVEAGEGPKVGKKGSAGTGRRKNSKQREVKKSGGQRANQASKKTEEQESPKAPVEVTQIVEEAKPSGAGTGELRRGANGRYLPRATAPGAEESQTGATSSTTKNHGDGAGGNGHGGGPSLMTEAGQKKLVCKLLDQADKLADKDSFKLSAADLIRLIQLQKEMTAKQPHKVTVQWVEDERK